MDFGSMRFYKFLLAFLLLVGTAIFARPLFSQTPDFSWTRSAGGSGFDSGNGVAIDPDGNSTVTGQFSGTASFGSQTLVSAGGYDIFVVRYDTLGNAIWAQKWGGTGNDIGNSIALDGNGNAYVTGRFYGSAQFGSTRLTSAGSYDAFIAKVDATGNLIWARSAGGKDTEIAYGISVDAAGNSVVTGYYTGTMTVGAITLPNAGKSDVFIAKYDPAGNLIWARGAGGIGSDYGYGVCQDGTGNILITGHFEASASFSGLTLTSAGQKDVFVAKYNADGNPVWAKRSGGSENEVGYSLDCDAAGNAYVTGYFQGTATFGSQTLASTGTADIFAAKYDPAGNVPWARRAGGSNNDYGQGISVAGDGSFQLTGYFYDSAIFENFTLTSAGLRDAFFAGYDQAGNLLWVKSAGGSQSDYGTSIALDPSGTSVSTGYFSGPASFGTSQIFGAGDYDGYVTRLALPYVSQTISFAKNKLNLISFNLKPKSPDAAVIFGSVSGLIIASDDEGRIFMPPNIVYPGHPGTNTIGTVQIEKSYAVYCSGDGTLTVRGIRAEPATTPISLAPGKLNKIAFIPVDAVAVEDIFNANTNSQVYSHLVEISDDQGRYFFPPNGAYPGHTGSNTIGKMLPGKGYGIYHNSSSALNFTYSGASGLAKSLLAEANPELQHFQYIVTGEPHPVFLRAINLALEAGAEVAVFANGSCVGARVWDADPFTPVIIWRAMPRFDLPGVAVGDSLSVRVLRPNDGVMTVLTVTGDEIFDSNRAFSLLEVTGVTGVNKDQQEGSMPESVHLHQNYPNPFNPATTIRFELNAPLRVRLVIYTAGGQIVTTLVDRDLSAGAHSLTWTGRDDQGIPVSSGVYFYQIQAGNFEKMHKMIYLK